MIGVGKNFVTSLAAHWSASRLIDELECLVSVMGAIVIAHAIGAHNISWAAFSGYMVMRGHAADSFWRGTLRIAGTLLGAMLALVIVPMVRHSWPLNALAAALIGMVALYGALTRRHSYAWLFIGLTFEMILLDQLDHPGDALYPFALSRLVEVVSGTLACIAVSVLSTLTLRRRWPGTRVRPSQPVGWHPHALRHAAQGAVALACLPFVAALTGLHETAQAAISIVAVMLVPVTSLGTSGFKPVSRKLLQRTAGCLAGAMLAGLTLFVAHGSVPLLLVGTALGVVIGRHIENGGHAYIYVGSQFTLAALVALVPDSYAGIALAPAIDRLCSILIGMAVLEPVLIVWHVLAPGTQPAAPQAITTSGDGE